MPVTRDHARKAITQMKPLGDFATKPPQAEPTWPEILLVVLIVLLAVSLLFWAASVLCGIRRGGHGYQATIHVTEAECRIRLHLPGEPITLDELRTLVADAGAFTP